MKFIVYIIGFLVIFVFSGCKTNEVTKKTRIEYMFPGGYELVVRNQDLVRLFEEEHPDIDVVLTNDPDWGLYATKVITRIAGGTPPDLINNNLTTCSIYIKKGLLRPIDDLLERDPEMQNLIADIYPQSLYTNALFEGRPYVIPAWQNPSILFYNLKVFQEAKIPEPDYTWDIPHLMEVAQKLTRDFDGDRRIDQFGFLYGIWDPETWLWPWGLSFFNHDFSHSLLNSEPVIKQLEWRQEQTTRYHASPSYGERADMSDDQIFIAGKVAMYVGNAQQRYYFAQKKDLQWRMTLWAKGPVRRSIYNNVIYWGMLKSTKYPEAVWEFMKFLIGTESQRRHVKDKDISVLKTVQDENLHWNPDQPAESNQAINDSLAYSTQESFFWDREIFMKTLEKMEPAFLIPPKQTMREACLNAHQEAEKLLSAILKRRGSKNEKDKP